MVAQHRAACRGGAVETRRGQLARLHSPDRSGVGLVRGPVGIVTAQRTGRAVGMSDRRHGGRVRGCSSPYSHTPQGPITNTVGHTAVAIMIAATRKMRGTHSTHGHTLVSQTGPVVRVVDGKVVLIVRAAGMVLGGDMRVKEMAVGRVEGGQSQVMGRRQVSCWDLELRRCP